MTIADSDDNRARDVEWTSLLDRVLLDCSVTHRSVGGPGARWTKGPRRTGRIGSLNGCCPLDRKRRVGGGPGVRSSWPNPSTQPFRLSDGGGSRWCRCREFRHGPITILSPSEIPGRRVAQATAGSNRPETRWPGAPNFGAVSRRLVASRAAVVRTPYGEHVGDTRRFGRRTLLSGAAATGAAVVGLNLSERDGYTAIRSDGSAPSGIRGLGEGGKLRPPNSLPHPNLPAGTDTLPHVEHVVILMMENHSFDDHFG